ncbi:hypothetical protein QAD02_020317 [Eretmocerus hayati]|uniref:Uncharacterized protein n=1 Tax=Eretmocerus hayati TaxID=131215 RepID=A0ACC2PRW1_9HYME|nr:hypothetical protein QAD02_020317 [Eretmocerus hayati]
MYELLLQIVAHHLDHQISRRRQIHLLLEQQLQSPMPVLALVGYVQALVARAAMHYLKQLALACCRLLLLQFAVPEEKFLHQIYLEEQFGCSSRPETLRDKKKSCSTAAIGYNYESNATASDPSKSPDVVIPPTEEEDEDSDIDLDMCVNVSQIEPSQAHEMNQVAQKYGLIGADYFSFLTQDFEEAETLRQARKQEEEKAMYSGRRSRRERRAFREKNMVGRVMSPPRWYLDYMTFHTTSSECVLEIWYGEEKISPERTFFLPFQFNFNDSLKVNLSLITSHLVANAHRNPLTLKDLTGRIW